MVITVTCPACASSFPVDPAKIPAGGVNARCTQCGDIFRVEKPAEPTPEPVMELPEITPVVEAAPPEPEEKMSVVPPAEPVVAAEPEPAADFGAPAADPFAEPAPFESRAPDLVPEVPTVVPEPEPVAPEPEPVAPEPEPAPTGFTFGKRDPTDKAKRLARVLVSDMIMYNSERHQSALAGGTLVPDFEEEIEKSWKEYVEQVGEEMASGDGHKFWTDALNDILAKGQQVF